MKIKKGSIRRVLPFFSLTSFEMLLSRIFRKLGLSLTTVGVLTLLFVAYQLWGTGFLTDRYQEDLKEDFAELVETVEETSSASTGLAEDVDDEVAYAEFLFRSEGEAIAQLIIPRMGLTQTVVSGVSSESLRRGPGHYPNTPLPGMPGNAALVGHRTTWGAPFSKIDELEPGDEISVQTIQGSFTYKVVEQVGGRGNFIISPQRFDVLNQNYEEYPNRLTLISCHPKLTARNRIVVVAELVGEPAEFFQRPETPTQAGLVFGFDQEVIDSTNTGDETESNEGTVLGESGSEVVDETSLNTEESPPENSIAVPTVSDISPESTPAVETIPSNATIQSTRPSSFGEGLEGDSSAILPSITWGVALLALLMSSNFVANRWLRWPTYVISFFPSVVVMTIWFFNLDRALPSY